MGTTTPSSFILQTAGSIGPNTTDTYNLGSASLEWNNAFIKNITSSATSGNFGFLQLNSGVLSPTTLTNTLSLGTTSSLGILDVRGTNTQSAFSGTIPVASISGQTSFAGLVVDNSGKGDLFAASSSGLNRFVITQNGQVGIGTGGVPMAPNIEFQIGQLNKQTTTPGGFYLAEISTNANGNSLIQGNWKNSSAWGIGPATNSTTDNSLRIGSTFSNTTWTPAQNMRLLLNGTLGNSAQAALDVGVANNTLPVASFSGSTNFAGLVVDNSGAGDLFTASSSGLNRFVITQAGNVGYWDNVPRETARQLSRFTVPIGRG